MKNIKIKISDIAKALEVSSISVSRALSGQVGVSEELRNKIIEKSKEMGYSKQKNPENFNILILHQKPYIQDNSNFSSMVQGIEKSIQKIGVDYSIEFVDKENQNNLYLPYKLSKGNTFDGVIFIGRFHDNYTQFIMEKIRYAVFYTGYSPSYNFDSVWFNFNNGGYKQCEYLVKQGHKNIGFIGNTSYFRNKERLLGISSALVDNGISINHNFFIDIEDNFNDKIIELINQKERPTAIICQWDYTAIRLIKLLIQNGLKVPEDISIIGSGNTEMSTLSEPSLTTLDVHIEYSCEVAVTLLLKRINNPQKPHENITINSTLVERDSVNKLK